MLSPSTLKLRTSIRTPKKITAASRTVSMISRAARAADLLGVRRLVVGQGWYIAIPGGAEGIRPGSVAVGHAAEIVSLAWMIEVPARLGRKFIHEE